MRYFLDTEFLDTGDGTELISVGMVAADGREFYAISADYDRQAVESQPWLVENVLAHLDAPGAPVPLSRLEIAAGITQFCTSCDDGRTPEVWAWNGTYDFYLLAKLYGRLLDVPAAVPTRFFDLKQWARQLGNVTVPAQRDDHHHALADARHDRDAWLWLAQREKELQARQERRIRDRLLRDVTAVINNPPPVR